MRWKIEVAPEAEKDFYDLPTDVRSRIRDKLRQVRKETLPIGSSLSASAPGWQSMRIGKYRILYILTRNSIEITAVYYGTMRIFGVCLRSCLQEIINKRYAKYGRNYHQ